jgi:hypothetical protein
MSVCDHPVVSTICGGVQSAVGDVTGGVADSFFNALATQAADGAKWALKEVITGWTQIPIDPVGNTGTGAALGTAADIRGATYWLVGFLAVGGVLFAALRTALERSGRPFAELARGMLILVVASAVGLAVVQLLVQAGDLYSTWIIDKSLLIDTAHTCSTAEMQQCQIEAATFNKELDLFVPVASGAGAMAPLVVIGTGIFLIIIAITQIVMMFGRAAALILLAGLLPVAAAAGVTGQAGQQMRSKYFSWLLALVLYKPVAATIYAAAFWQIRNALDQKSISDSTTDPGMVLTRVLIGITMFLMALVALPALMRLVAPAVGAVAGGGTAGAAFAGGAVGELATGAVQRAARGGGGGGQSAPTGSGPAPPTGGAAGGATSGAATGAAGGGGAGAGAAAGGGAAGGGAAGGAAAGGGAAGGAAAGAGAAAGPIGLAAVAGAEAAKKVANVGPDAARHIGGTAASGIGEGQ